MKKLLSVAVLAAATLFAGVAVAATNASASDVCPDNTDGFGPKVDVAGDPVTVPYTAPSGKLVTAYCVKAGSENGASGGGVEIVMVDPPRRTVTIDHPTIDSVSHYSVMLTDALEWEPPMYPPFEPEDCVEYRLEKWISTWSDATGWSPWVDWPGAGPLGWGELPDAMTGDHGGEPYEDGHQVFAYVVVDERPRDSGYGYGYCTEQTTTTSTSTTTSTTTTSTTVKPEESSTTSSSTTSSSTTSSTSTSSTTLPASTTTDDVGSGGPTTAPTTLPPGDTVQQLPPSQAAPTTSAAGTPASGQLPATGGSPWETGAVALVVLLLGGVALFGSRRAA